jgi:oligopeptide/dipeptide ABC transporter ATP-binding protein
MVVIYRGEVFESGPVDTIIHAPVNPYTQSLLSAVPVLVGLEQPGPDRFIPRAAMEADVGEGVCLFSERCPFATDKCRSGHPDLLPIGSPERFNRCFYPQARRVTALPTEAPPAEPVSR